jgi:succinyl-CoA synthetase alpha subunit
MSILMNRDTRVVVQGITGREGGFHAQRCQEYGTQIVAGVTPGRGGAKWNETVPVFNTVEQAVREAGANTSLIFVPAAFAADAIVESADAGVKVVACITEGIPVQDMIKVDLYLKTKPGTILIGPNCPGAISPGARCKVGIMPGNIHKPGHVGVVSRSGTLTYEAVGQLTALGIGQSTCVGIGGDPITGLSFVDVLRMFGEDDETEAVVLIGEIGGSREQDAARYIAEHFKKPVAFLIVGRSAPPGRRMGHAGAIITGKDATAAAKIQALSDAGARHIPTPADIGVTMRDLLRERSPRRGASKAVAAKPASRLVAAKKAPAKSAVRPAGPKGGPSKSVSRSSRALRTDTKRSGSAARPSRSTPKPSSRSMQARRTPATREGSSRRGRQ